jgi:hypothetical protein
MYVCVCVIYVCIVFTYAREGYITELPQNLYYNLMARPLIVNWVLISQIILIFLLADSVYLSQ